MSSNIRQKQVISQTKSYIKQHFADESSGHDWWHIYRVRKLALQICKTEGGDIFLIEMAALLHDLDDWKLAETSSESKTEKWLQSTDIENEERIRILEIISEVSFKGAGVKTEATTIEAQIVQDADRLDAIGAIGIARTFAYGGNKGRLLYDPEIEPVMHQSFEDYKKTTAPTINHFYEKLLLLKNRINTKTGNKIAENRHRYMENFLNQFFNEWEAKI